MVESLLGSGWMRLACVCVEVRLEVFVVWQFKGLVEVCPEISSDTEACLSEQLHCHGNPCSSPERGGDLVCVDPAGGSPLMMTSPLHH